MMNKKIILAIKNLCKALTLAVIIAGCSEEKKPASQPVQQETVKAAPQGNEQVDSKQVPGILPAGQITTGTTKPAEILNFAKTLIGVPYLYASTDPAKGFDCSGFVTYVFNHFNIAIPRSSVDFTNVGKEIDYIYAQPGDLILFTGTDSTIRVVGHMGIIESNENGRITFIHSTSGKAKGVVITSFENYYKSRFVKVIRIFPDYYFE
ncbi:MAG: C40 family peptidase [Bacteroidota bacterium]